MFVLTSSSTEKFKASLPLGFLKKRKKDKMANIKSAKKRVLTAERNHEKNVAFKTSIKTALKKV